MGMVCRGDPPGHGKKPVYLAFEALVGYVDAGLHEALGVGFAFVPQRIETGGDDVAGASREWSFARNGDARQSARSRSSRR